MIHERSQQEIIKYDQKLLDKLERASKERKLTSSMIQHILKEAYEDRTELSIAAIYLHNISYNFELIAKELKTIDAAYQQIDLEVSTEEEAKQALEKTFQTLETTSQCSPHMLQDLWMSVQHLHWYIEDIILAGLKETRRFKEEFETYIAPVKKRLEERKIEEKLEESKKIEEPKKEGVQEPVTTKKVEPFPDIVTPENQEKVGPSPDIVIPEKKASPPVAQGFPSDIIIPEKKIQKSPASIYDPFQFQTMEELKKACKAIGTERILSILEVLERPHAFFNFLERLEGEYDPESPFTELLWMSELMESQSAMDFVLGFAKVKFLPHGYFDANGVAIPFNKETKKIEKMGGECYLKISSRYMETPKGIFKRLMQMMLGYEGTDVLGPEENPQIIGLLRMDHIVTEEEKEKLHARIAFLA